jgi:site-specific recombinase XerD
MPTTKRNKCPGYPGVSFSMVKKRDEFGRWSKERRVYYGIFQGADGKQKEKKLGGKDEGITSPAKAAAARARLIENIKAPASVRKGSIVTLNQLWDEYNASRRSRSSRRKDEYLWNQKIRPGIGKTRAAFLTVHALEDWRENLIAEYRPSTAWNAMELVRRAYNWGRKSGKYHIPKLIVPMPKGKAKNHVTERLTEEEERRLFEAMKTSRSKDVPRILKLCYFAMLRQHEACKIKVKDINFSTRSLKVIGKGESNWEIPLNALAWEVIEEALKDKPKGSEYLFPSPHKKGEPIRNTLKAAQRIFKKAEVKIRPHHGLRHAFACRLLQHGTTLKVLQELLRHEHIETTMRYLDVYDEERIKGAEAATASIRANLAKV